MCQPRRTRRECVKKVTIFDQNKFNCIQNSQALSGNSFGDNKTLKMIPSSNKWKI